MYLDDGLCAVSGEGTACAASQLVQHTLEQAGFAVYPDKSVWKPTQRLTWLAFVIDMTMGQIEVPDSKIVSLCSMLDCCRHACQVRAKYLATILGKLRL